VSLSNALLTSFPQPASTSEYDEAAAEFESLLSELPGAVAVYRFGNVRAPGISDLDRLVVVETSGPRPVPDRWRRLSARTRYLALHSPFLVDSRTFATHRWFSDASPLDLGSGSSVEIEPRPCPEFTNALIAAEGLVETLLKLAKLGTTGRAKVRSLLCELNTVRLNLELAGIDRLAAPRAWDLADDVGRLRETWWTLGPDERVSRFRRLLATAVTGTWEALAVLGARHSEGDRVPEVPLRAEWSRVTLVPGNTSGNGFSRASPQLVGRSRRLGEKIWRAVPRRVEVPAAALGLLGRTRPEHRDVRAERDEIVRRYDAFMSEARGYSALGVARVFLQR
jgi:hypothetical protein